MAREKPSTITKAYNEGQSVFLFFDCSHVCFYRFIAASIANIFQMDQTEFESQNIYGNIQQCSQNPDMDCLMCLPAAFVYQIQSQNWLDYSPDATGITTQPV